MFFLKKVYENIHFTLPRNKIELLRNGHFPILHPRLPKWSWVSKTKRIFEIHWGKLEIIQFILSDKYMDRPGQSLRHFFSKSNSSFITSDHKSFCKKKKIWNRCTWTKVPKWQSGYFLPNCHFGTFVPVHWFKVFFGKMTSG